MTLAENPAQTQPWLTNDIRDQLVADFDRDGYVVLPMKLPADLNTSVLAAIDRIADADRKADPSVKSVKRHNCVSLDAAFRELMMFPPALQLCHDLFGPSFHLNQSNFISRMKQEITGFDAAAAIDWHADGPRPNQLPKVQTDLGPVMGLHYFKLGYFLTDVPLDGGPLKVVRGSHKRPELDEKGAAFDEADYGEDVVHFDCEAGTVVAFHQALWHAAAPNASGVERKNVYISYCPTWMKPLDYDLPRAGELGDDLTGEERFLLGEYRPPLRFWLPNGDDKQRLSRYGR